MIFCLFSNGTDLHATLYTIYLGSCLESSFGMTGVFLFITTDYLPIFLLLVGVNGWLIVL